MLRYAALNHELANVIQRVYARGSNIILDYAHENCPLSEADHLSAVTTKIMSSVPSAMFALKLTSFGSRESPSRANTHTRSVIEHGVRGGGRVCIDAEDVLYPKLCYEYMRTFNREEPRVYKTYQMYRRDALKELEMDICTSQKDGFILGAKLVRGAYLGKQRGLLPTKDAVDASFRRGFDMTLSAGPHVHTLAATHNKQDIQTIRSVPHDRYAIAQLLGMDDDFPDYVYVPYGSLSELTPYLFRRLLERLKWSGH